MHIKTIYRLFNNINHNIQYIRCKEFQKKQVSVLEQLQDLLETNIRQRGIGNTNQRKMGLCIKELDRIYGIREGSAGKVSKNLEGNNFIPKTEDELLKSLGLGVDKRTIQNYKKLTEMIPELEELVDTGIRRKATGGKSVPVAFFLDYIKFLRKC